MAKNTIPTTPAIRYLDNNSIPFEPALYPYEERGGTHHSASCLGVDEHQVIKTLVLEIVGTATPLIVLMHGDQELSLKQMARHLGVKGVRLCNPATAQKHTGYQVGGTSPFGTRNPLPVYVEATILTLPDIWINGGKRGLLVNIHPQALIDVLHAIPVSVATE